LAFDSRAQEQRYTGLLGGVDGGRRRIGEGLVIGVQKIFLRKILGSEYYYFRSRDLERIPREIGRRLKWRRG
jgi:hypothetical protein